MVLSGRTVGHGLVDDTCVIITSAYQERHLAAFLGLIGLTEFSFARAPTRAVADSDPGAADFVPFLR